MDNLETIEYALTRNLAGVRAEHLNQIVTAANNATDLDSLVKRIQEINTNCFKVEVAYEESARKRASKYRD